MPLCIMSAMRILTFHLLALLHSDLGLCDNDKTYTFIYITSIQDYCMIIYGQVGGDLSYEGLVSLHSGCNDIIHLFCKLHHYPR